MSGSADASSAHQLLWRLIEERARPGADTTAIDARIRKQFERARAVVYTDLVGFSKRTAEFGILHFLTLIHQKELLLRESVEAAGGRLVKAEADSWLLLFEEPLAALETMLDCQGICEEHNAGLASADRVELCVGIGFGSLLVIGNEDVWGREVNTASRLGEDLARGGETLVSDAVRRAAIDAGSDRRFAPVEAEGLAGPCWRVLDGSESG